MSDYLGFEERTWAEAAEALGTPVHEYERARALDDRHPDKLAVIAGEIEAEGRPSVEELLAERYGKGGGRR